MLGPELASKATHSLESIGVSGASFGDQPGVFGISSESTGVEGQTAGRGVAGILGTFNGGANCLQGSVQTLCFGAIGDASFAPNNAGVGVRGVGSYAGVWGSGPTFAGLFDGAVTLNGTTRGNHFLPVLGGGSHFVGDSVTPWTAMYAGAFNVTSDLRLKSDVADAQYGLEEIMDLRPVSYLLNSDPESGPHLGLIAQDVEHVIPEVVQQGEGDEGMRSITYTELIPVLIRAIQEQQAEIDSLTGGNGGSSSPLWTAAAMAAAALALAATGTAVALRRRA